MSETIEKHRSYSLDEYFEIESASDTRHEFREVFPPQTMGDLQV